MRFVLIGFTALLVHGCVFLELHAKSIPAVCLDGVEYWATGYALTPKYMPNGSISTCSQKN